MKRLTERLENGAINVKYASQHETAIHRLVTIEDILGDEYDLELVQKLIQAYKEGRYIIMKEPEQAGVSRLRELAQADREGRCVVLSEPMSPMVQIPGDTDVYCPNCAQSLSGGWPLSDAGDYRKMCQCPHCGQSIDDTKCEFSEEAIKGENP